MSYIVWVPYTVVSDAEAVEDLKGQPVYIPWNAETESEVLEYLIAVGDDRPAACVVTADPLELKLKIKEP